jgi:hypothetical protein
MSFPSVSVLFAQLEDLQPDIGHVKGFILLTGAPCLGRTCMLIMAANFGCL